MRGQIGLAREGATTRAAVIGAGGGIGAALVASLAERGSCEAIHALSRDPAAAAGPVVAGRIDVTDEASIRAAAASIRAPLGLVIVATGLLHEEIGGESRGPERSLGELDPGWMAQSFAVNAIGPAMVLRHFAPLLASDSRAVVACLSARVGSISDNRLGGWYSYRASKAALNMIVRTASIEIARKRPRAICVALHPGTVDTALSAPFQRNLPEGQLTPPAVAAARLLSVLNELTPAQTGRCFDWAGEEVPA